MYEYWHHDIWYGVLDTTENQIYPNTGPVREVGMWWEHNFDHSPFDHSVSLRAAQ